MEFVCTRWRKSCHPLWMSFFFMNEKLWSCFWIMFIWCFKFVSNDNYSAFLRSKQWFMSCWRIVSVDFTSLKAELRFIKENFCNTFSISWKQNLIEFFRIYLSNSKTHSRPSKQDINSPSWIIWRDYYVQDAFTYSNTSL